MNLLILSIGSNPMPNFIVADYLLDKKREDKDELPVPDTILFIYSDSTKKFKQSITEQLRSSSKVDFEELDINIGDQERNFDKVKSGVGDVLKKLSEGEQLFSIHLNYTGGTKPMAIAIYAAVAGYLKNSLVKGIFSDLSPNEFRLTLRDNSKFPPPGRGKDLADYVNISIKELYQLHCLELVALDTKSNDYYCDEFARFLIGEIGKYKKNNRAFFEVWDCDFKKLCVDKCQESLEEYSKFKEICDGNGKIDKKLYKFIRGLWLESYLFQLLKELKNECGLTDIACNIETEIKGRKFEIDAIAIKGCRTFVFTCTTGHKSSECKGKAFEGIYRAEQLGGEHSKTVLVCFADDRGNSGNDEANKTVTNIRKDMSQFDAVKNFIILGSDDIEDKEKFRLRLIDIFKGE